MTIFIVVQLGGSVTERRLCDFDSAEAAAAFIHDCRRHSYDGLGPYALADPLGITDVLSVFSTICADVAMFEHDAVLCHEYLDWTDDDYNS